LFGGISDDGGIRFRLMCYNVLSPTLQQMHQNIYDRCNPRALDWTARWASFCIEIEFIRPDIVCLQEIDAGFLEDYNNYFHHAGYQGVFKKRTGDKSDGCAIFYRDTKFRMIDHINVEYLQKSVSLLNRDNIALLVKLETKEGTPRRIVVGTTHLLFNYKRNVCEHAKSNSGKLIMLYFLGCKSCSS
jgi:protein angel